MAQRYSHSALQLYRLCGLRFKGHYVDHLEPLQPAGRHDLAFGAAFAAGQAVLRRQGTIAEAQAAFASEYPAEKYPNPLPSYRGGITGKSFANGINTLVDYRDRWAEDDKYHEVLSVEKRVDTNDHILKLDLVTRDIRDGQVYGWDSKATVSYLNNDYWQRFDPNSQVRFYTDYIKKEHGHCGGFYIDATRFYHYSKAYTPRVGPDKGVQKPAGDYADFARMLFNPNEDCLQLERDNMVYWIGRIERDKQTGVWGYNDQACHQYGRECEYLKLCSAGYSWPQDEELVLSYYRQQCPKVLSEGRCQLGLDHEGDHDPTVVVAEDYEIETEVEDAVS